MRRTRSAAALAAGIIVVSVFGGSTAASAAQPPAPTINLSSSFTMAATDLIGGDLTGVTNGMGLVVEVYSTLDPVVPACTDTVPWAQLIGGWGCNAPLVDGYNSFYAVSYEDDGARDELSPASNTVIVARGGTQEPLIASPMNGDIVVDPTPVFSGTGPVLGTISVTGGPFSPACSANVDEFGNWTCESSSVMPPDTYGNFQAVATRADLTAGGVSGFTSITVAPGEPAVNYDVSPGSVTATATGEMFSDVSVELYAVGDNGEGYSFTITAGCPTLIDMLPFGHERAYATSPISCPFTGLAPGIWNIYSGQRVDGIYSSFRNDFFRVPTTPTIAAQVNADRSVTVSGSAEAGGLINVFDEGGFGVCQAAVVGTTWSCTVAPSPGAYRYRAYSQDQGFVAQTGGEPADSVFLGASAYSAYTTTTTVPEPAPTPTPTPTPQPVAVIVPLPSIVLPSEAAPGDQIVVEGSNAPPGSIATIELHSDPVTLGSAVVGPDGSFSKLVTIPNDTQPGDHHIVIGFAPADGSAPTQSEQAFTVTDPPVAEQPVATAPTETVEKSSAAPAPRAQPGAVSALTVGLISPVEILSNPIAIATAGSVGLALVLLVLIPAEFFGEALASHYGSVGGFFSRRRRLSGLAARAANWIAENRFLAGAGLVFLTSVVFCFVDPGFGFDLTSLRLLLSCAASILLVNFLSAGITERVAEKAWKVPTRLEVMPWGLAIAVLAVLTSRLMNFSPGFLVGSIIGVSVIGAVSNKLETRVILLWSSVVWGIAIAAWALAPLIPVLPSSHPAAFFTALLSDSLVATAAGGLTALVVALLPIALFDGGELFKNSKLRWAIAFGIAVASFCIVVLPQAGNWMGLGDGLITWLLATAAFIVLAIVTYIFARRRNGARKSRLLQSRSQT